MVRLAASKLIVCVCSVVFAVCVKVPLAPIFTSSVTTSLFVVEFPLERVREEAAVLPSERELMVVIPEVRSSVGANV